MVIMVGLVNLVAGLIAGGLVGVWATFAFQAWVGRAFTAKLSAQIAELLEGISKRPDLDTKVRAEMEGYDIAAVLRATAICIRKRWRST